MAQIYCVRDFPFKTHYIHSSEQCMARPHSFLGLASDEIAVLLSCGGGYFYHSLAGETATQTASAKALPFAAPCLYVKP